MIKIVKLKNQIGYGAGTDGFIYSSKIGNSGRTGAWKKRKCFIQTSGKYYIVNLSHLGIHKTYRVHRLICEAFHGHPKNKDDTTSHLDGNWRNNKPSNLKWENLSDNFKRKKEHGTDDTGIKNSRAKINLATLKSIRRELKLKNLTQESIGKKFGLSRLFITKIANGHRYKNQGY